MLACAAFGFRVIVLEEACLLQQYPSQKDQVKGLVDIQNDQAAPEELPEAVALPYTVPNTDDGYGYEDEHAQDYQHPSKEPCTLEALFPGLDGIHNVLRRRTEQSLVLHQSDCCIEHQQDGEDEAERQYEGRSHSLYAFCARPNLSIAMADKAEVATVATLA